MSSPSLRCLTLALLAGTLACSSSGIDGLSKSAESPALPGDELAPGDTLPQFAENFVLLDHEGNAHELERESEAKAVVLVSHGLGCPVGRLQNPRIMELRDEFADAGVVFWFLNAGSPDDFEELLGEIEEFSIDVPVLLDETQLVTRALGIERMAEALVIDPRDGRIVYRGMIDDRVGYGTQRPAAEHEYLRDALRAQLAHEPIETPRTEARGCLIWFDDPKPAGEPISYAHDVAPVLAEKCASCHQAGGMAPWAMDGYERVRRWSPMMREVVRTKRMPPWFADPHYGEFANDAGLTLEEARLLVHWIEAGSEWRERGTEPDPLAEREPVLVTDWPLGEPDLVIPIDAQQDLPATGLLNYHYVTGTSPLSEGRWIRAAVLRPTNPRVLHHGTVYLEHGSDEVSEQLQVELPGSDARNQKYFALYVPGVVTEEFPAGTGKYMPANSKFTFELHYTTTGKPESDRSELGLYFMDEPPEKQLFLTTATVWRLDIAPGERHVPARAVKKFEFDSIVYELVPHMHYRGRRMTFDLHRPDGTVERLLSVPNYDFNWQLAYRLKEPVFVPAGSRMVCWGSFDNSSSNPLNPDPEARVEFGYQTMDEMWIGSAAFVLADE